MPQRLLHCLVIPLATLCGCHLFSSGKISETCDEIDRCSDTGVFAGVAIDKVTPAYGHSSGGYTVTIEGAGLGEIESASIGGDAAALISAKHDSLVVRVPSGSPGSSDVTVVDSSGETYVLVQGFEYFPDAEGAVQLMEAKRLKSEYKSSLTTTRNKMQSIDKELKTLHRQIKGHEQQKKADQTTTGKRNPSHFQS